MIYFPLFFKIRNFKYLTLPNMKHIKKKYIVDENQKTIAVQIDIQDFNEIQKILEDYGLGKLMDENAPEDNLTLEEARTLYYKKKKNENSYK